jgi:hypothetical protein
MQLIGPLQKIAPAITRTNDLGARELWLQARVLGWTIENMEVPK